MPDSDSYVNFDFSGNHDVATPAQTLNSFNDGSITTISSASTSSKSNNNNSSSNNNSSNITTESSGFNKSSLSISPVAKRQINSATVSRIRPQSSYSARVLVFDDSDQENGGGNQAQNSSSNNNNNNSSSVAGSGGATGGGAAVAGGSKQYSSSGDGTKSSIGLDVLTSSPKNDSSSMMSTSNSLLRNLTKSSSGNLTGSSKSLPGKDYSAILRKISYQHNYSMRSVSNGECLFKIAMHFHFKFHYCSFYSHRYFKSYTYA